MKQLLIIIAFVLLPIVAAAQNYPQVEFRLNNEVVTPQNSIISFKQGDTLTVTIISPDEKLCLRKLTLRHYVLRQKRDTTDENSQQMLKLKLVKDNNVEYKGGNTYSSKTTIRIPVNSFYKEETSKIAITLDDIRKDNAQNRYTKVRPNKLYEFYSSYYKENKAMGIVED